MMRSALPLWAGIVLFCVPPSLAAEFQVMDRLAVSGLAVFSWTATVASGLTAAIGIFTASGAVQPSVETASSIKVNAADVVAPYFLGNGSALTGIVADDSSRVSKSDGMTGPLTLSNSTLNVLRLRESAPWARVPGTPAGGSNERD